MALWPNSRLYNLKGCICFCSVLIHFRISLQSLVLTRSVIDRQAMSLVNMATISAAIGLSIIHRIATKLLLPIVLFNLDQPKSISSKQLSLLLSTQSTDCAVFDVSRRATS